MRPSTGDLKDNHQVLTVEGRYDKKQKKDSQLKENVLIRQEQQFGQDNTAKFRYKIVKNKKARFKG